MTLDDIYALLQLWFVAWLILKMYEILHKKLAGLKHLMKGD